MKISRFFFKTEQVVQKCNFFGDTFPATRHVSCNPLLYVERRFSFFIPPSTLSSINSAIQKTSEMRVVHQLKLFCRSLLALLLFALIWYLLNAIEESFVETVSAQNNCELCANSTVRNCLRFALARFALAFAFYILATSVLVKASTMKYVANCNRIQGRQQAGAFTRQLLHIM